MPCDGTRRVLFCFCWVFTARPEITPPSRAALLGVYNVVAQPGEAFALNFERGQVDGEAHAATRIPGRILATTRSEPVEHSGNKCVSRSHGASYYVDSC